MDLFFSFRGRISRMQFFLGNLALFCLGVFLAMIIMGIAFSNVSVGANANAVALLGAIGVGMIFLLPIGLVSTYCSVCLIIKRLHDIGLSGWFVLPLLFGGFLLMPLLLVSPDLFAMMALIFNFLQLGGYLCLLFIPGQDQRNEYGEVFS